MFIGLALGTERRGGGSSGRAAYTGLVATRAFVPTGSNAGNKQAMTRTRHQSRVAITSLKIAIPGWYASGSGDAALGGTATVTASVEYPAGTFTQIKFSGVASGTVPNGGTLLSDACTVSIPNATDFFIRIFFQSATGILFGNSLQADANNGEAMNYAASGLSDQTMGGTVTAGGSGFCFYPCAIIGTTNKPSIMLAGDSTTQGQGDSWANGQPSDSGGIARGIGPSFAYINAGVPGAQSTDWGGGAATQRYALLSTYCTHLICGYGINDLVAGGQTGAATLTRLQAVWAYMPGAVYQTTVTPYTPVSSDSYATVGGQTVGAQNTNRTALNALLRASPSGLTGFFEATDQIESARDSGLWKAPGYTTDGLHGTATGYAAIATAINPLLFT
jgi:lysophospholipase L1-like esterase